MLNLKRADASSLTRDENFAASSSTVKTLLSFGFFQGVDDYTLRRFLRARDLDIEKASNMFLKYLSWKRSSIPNGSITLSEVPNELAQNKMFMQGLDRKGRPIVVVFGNRHKPSMSSLEEFKRKCLAQHRL